MPQNLFCQRATGSSDVYLCVLILSPVSLSNNFWICFMNHPTGMGHSKHLLPNSNYVNYRVNSYKWGSETSTVGWGSLLYGWSITSWSCVDVKLPLPISSTASTFVLSINLSPSIAWRTCNENKWEFTLQKEEGVFYLKCTQWKVHWN